MSAYVAEFRVDVRKYIVSVRYLVHFSWSLVDDNLIQDEDNILDAVLHRVSLDKIYLSRHCPFLFQTAALKLATTFIQ